jgi:hypothetical protein
MRFEVLFLLLTAVMLGGCSGEKNGPPAGDTDSTTENASMAIGDNTADSLTYDVCSLLSEDAVAEALGGAALEPARRDDYGSTHCCEYRIDPAGPDDYEYCAILVMPPSPFEDSESALKTETELGAKATAEALANLGDKAFVVHNEAEKQSTIHILLKDRMAIKVKADRYENARKLADLILSKLR